MQVVEMRRFWDKLVEDGTVWIREEVIKGGENTDAIFFPVSSISDIGVVTDDASLVIELTNYDRACIENDAAIWVKYTTGRISTACTGIRAKNEGATDIRFNVTLRTGGY